MNMKTKQPRSITINYTSYLLPEDMTTREMSDLVATLASLQVIDTKAREISGKYERVYYTHGVRISTEVLEREPIMPSEAHAQRYLDALEQEAAQPETMGDAL
jgi:hypothetical protein